ncbi:MAG: response regulator [Bryobacteraceae bacterium]
MSPQDPQSSHPPLAADLETVSRLEQQLREAQPMQAVGLLAAGIAHDFNNLLTVMNGYSALLLTAHELPKEARELIAIIRDTGDRAAALVRGLLTFSRMPQEPRIVDLSESVRELSALVRRLLPANIEFTTILETRLNMVLADPGCIQRALLNLVFNSRDAMPLGGKLEIQTANLTLDAASHESHPRLPAGSYILLTVSDTGTGMDDETKQHLFEPFHTSKPPSAGAGIGLSMVQQTVTQSGGYLSVQSEKGNGTTVRIYLPRSMGDKTPEASELNRTLPRGHETILIVEARPDVRRLLRTMLQSLGYSVLEAGSATEAAALSSGRAEVIDLLVVDVVPTDSTGVELARRLRESRPRLPVLYISGYAQDSAILKSAQESGAELLAKPFTMAAFAERMHRILDRQKRHRILFVDDDATVALFASRVLREAGFEVLVVGNGSVALSTIETERPDLVITDLVMPGQQGLETIMMLRKSHPSLPVIATSGAFDGHFLKPAMMLGARATLPKPFSAEELLEAVRAALGTR